ncbi:MAG: hypothetical protein ABFD08_09145 [Syntrophomonas sp.]
MNKRQRASLLVALLLLAFLVGAWCYFQWAGGNTMRMFDGSQSGADVLSNGGIIPVTDNIQNTPGELNGITQEYPETGEKIFQDYLSTAKEPLLRNENDIKKKYLPRFVLLQEIYEQKLDKLLADAARDYTANEQSKTEISQIKLIGKYYNKGRELEADCDMCFERLMGQMEDELQQAQISSKLPESIRQEYQQTKKQRRKELLQLMGKENN